MFSESENNNNNNNKWYLKRSKRPWKQAVKEKKKKKDNGTKLVQWAILSFSHKTPPTLFSLHFGETSFRWAQVENTWASPKIFLSLSPYQTTPFLIFSPILSPNFSILPKIHPSKHSVTEGPQKWQNPKPDQAKAFGSWFIENYSN